MVRQGTALARRHCVPLRASLYGGKVGGIMHFLRVNVRFALLCAEKVAGSEPCRTCGITPRKFHQGAYKREKNLHCENSSILPFPVYRKSSIPLHACMKNFRLYRGKKKCVAIFHWEIQYFEFWGNYSEPLECSAIRDCVARVEKTLRASAFCAAIQLFFFKQQVSLLIREIIKYRSEWVFSDR